MANITETEVRIVRNQANILSVLFSIIDVLQCPYEEKQNMRKKVVHATDEVLSILRKKEEN